MKIIVFAVLGMVEKSENILKVICRSGNYYGCVCGFLKCIEMCVDIGKTCLGGGVEAQKMR